MLEDFAVPAAALIVPSSDVLVLGRGPWFALSPQVDLLS